MHGFSSRSIILIQPFIIALFVLAGHERTQPNSFRSIASFRVPHINYILLGMFCCLAFLQNSVFVEWNPIANSALSAFSPEWSAATLASQINLATFTSPFIQWPVWFAIQKYGKLIFQILNFKKIKKIIILS